MTTALRWPRLSDVEAELARREKATPAAGDGPDAALLRMGRRVETEHQRAFLEAIERLRGTVDVDALANALTAGRPTTEAIEAGLAALPDDLAAQWRPILARAFLEAARVTATEATALLTIDFRLVNAEAVQWAQRATATRVVQVSDETRAAIRDVTAEALAGRRSVRQTARLIQDMVGLDRRRAATLEGLEAEWRARGLSEEAVARRVGRARQALLRDRGLTIARTEVMDAANRGQEALWALAQRQGRLSAETARRVWIATDDDRVEAICLGLDGETAPLVGGSYPGGYTGPPAHPRCRCTQGLVFERP